ncbi:MAG: aminotransferase class V-fold PLP-dependent enzyme [Oscillospiraceae bacterium]|nr:aminotransferase class V-fold PLP-dependent enzyme [Oscillospiraceae bacterium]
MIYLDNGATSYYKPDSVKRAVLWAMENCANPGRGGYEQSNKAAHVVLGCRDRASRLFNCDPEHVVFTSNCTHGLNIAIRSLIKPGAKVLISGFEHNAVLRPLVDIGVKLSIAATKLFNWDDTLSSFEKFLRQGVDAAVFTHVSNVFGYVLPVEEIAELCKYYNVPFVIDAAQSAGSQKISFGDLGADFIAMPGHKGLLGPQGTGLLLCKDMCEPLLFGGTGSMSAETSMPDFLPDRLEAGTLNVPGIAGLSAGLAHLLQVGTDKICSREVRQADICAEGLKELGVQVFDGEHRSGTVSFVSKMDCEELAQLLSDMGIAVRAGLHCAPIAHRSVGTFNSGTVRVSFGLDASPIQSKRLLESLNKIKSKRKIL